MDKQSGVPEVQEMDVEDTLSTLTTDIRNVLSNITDNSSDEFH